MGIERSMRALMIQKAWELLEKEGLEGLTPQHLALYCETTESDIRSLYPTSLSILLLLWDDVSSQATLQAIPDTPHDCLFESIMIVLEILQPNQQAIKRFLADLLTAPCWLKDILPYVTKWSRQTLQQAGFSTSDLVGTLKVHAFTAFCFYILKVWSNDDSPSYDLTLVKLDQGLSKLTKFF